MEWLDVVDERGVPTGDVVLRETAHTDGIRHRTSHVWILRRYGGRLQVLLQRRAPQKDSFPGCYDISSAGHIPAGADFVDSALRELQEELGVTARPDDLEYCGQRSFTFQSQFHGVPFHDVQVSNVYRLWLDRPAHVFRLQAEEVSEVRWFDYVTCLQAVRQKAFPTCIYPEELRLVAKGLRLP